MAIKPTIFHGHHGLCDRFWHIFDVYVIAFHATKTGNHRAVTTNNGYAGFTVERFNIGNIRQVIAKGGRQQAKKGKPPQRRRDLANQRMPILFTHFPANVLW